MDGDDHLAFRGWQFSGRLVDYGHAGTADTAWRDSPDGAPEDFTWGTPSEVTGAPGDPAANKQILRRAVDDFWNQRDVGAIDELYATDYLGHDPTGLHGATLEEFKQSIAGLFTAFPDFHLTIDDEVAEGDKVVKGWTVTGTHRGDFKGILPTENHIAITGINFYRIADGEIVETWWSSDAPWACSSNSASFPRRDR